MILALLLAQQLAAASATPPPGWRDSAPKIDPKTMEVNGHKPRNCSEQCEMMSNVSKAMCKDPQTRKRMRGMSVDQCISKMTSNIGAMCKKSCKGGKFDDAAMREYGDDAAANYEVKAKRAGPGRSKTPPGSE